MLLRQLTYQLPHCTLYLVQGDLQLDSLHNLCFAVVQMRQWWLLQALCERPGPAASCKM